MPERFLRGSYTLEAAYIMTITAALLTAVLYMAFFLNDRAVLYAMAADYAERVLCMSEEPVFQDGEIQTGRIGGEEHSRSFGKGEKEALQEAFRTAAQKRMCMTELRTAELSVSEKEIVLVAEGVFPFPGRRWLSFFGEDAAAVKTEVRVERSMPYDMQIRLRRVFSEQKEEE